MQIDIGDAQRADEAWAEREADILADADFTLDPEALENVVGLDALPFYGELRTVEERTEFERWLDSFEAA